MNPTKHSANENAQPSDSHDSIESCVHSYATETSSLADIEKAIICSSSTSDFPWMTEGLEPIRTESSRQPSQWLREGQFSSRNVSAQSGRYSRNGPREDLEDLGLIASDMDYYAGAVSDYVQQNLWEEEEEFSAHESDGSSFGLIQIIRADDIKRTISNRSRKSERDVNLVSWDGPDDPENPKNWTRRRKWLATMTVSLLTFISPVSSSMIAPTLPQIKTDLNIASDLEVELALSVFVLGFALGPLVLGPLSELFGRRSVLLLSGVFYLIFNLAAGFAHNAAEVIAFRFLSGLGGSAPLGIGGGVIADIWMPQERGRAMALYSLMPLLGPAIGPVAGGFIAQWSTWRWVFWSTSIVAALFILMGAVLLKETYPATILAKKKAHLSKLTGNPHLRTEYDTPNRSFTTHLTTALKRPFIMLFTQPIVQILALYIGYLFGVLYLVLASFPQVWTEKYHQPPAIAGLNYISLGIGFFIGTQIAARFADRIYRHLKQSRIDQVAFAASPPSPSGPSPSPALAPSAPVASPGPPAPAAAAAASASLVTSGIPEFRIPLMFPGSLLVPLGLLIYGWTSAHRTHWIFPDLGAALFAAGNQLVFQNCQIYLVDAYTRYAASAIAATAVLRSLGGFAFPLFAPKMYGTLGYGWGNTLLAFLGIGVGLPVPGLLWRYGEGLRGRSGFAAG